MPNGDTSHEYALWESVKIVERQLDEAWERSRELEDENEELKERCQALEHSLATKHLKGE